MLAKCIIMSNISGGFALICQFPILRELNYSTRCHFGSEAWEALWGPRWGGGQVEVGHGERWDLGRHPSSSHTSALAPVSGVPGREGWELAD